LKHIHYNQLKRAALFAVIGGMAALGARAQTIQIDSDTTIGSRSGLSANRVYQLGEGVVFTGSGASGNAGGLFNGGASYSLTFSGTTGSQVVLLDNRSTTGHGGALYAKSVSILGEDSYVFADGNRANVAGGVMYVEGGGILIEGSATFTNNRAVSDSGGALALMGGSLVFSGTNASVVISSNTASYRGGGIRANNASVTFAGNVTMENNTETGVMGGGAIHTEKSVSFTNTGATVVISGNSAGGEGGGGIYSGDTVTFAGSAVTLDHNTMRGNSNGGAISTLNGIAFTNAGAVIGITNNTAGRTGGGLYVASGSLGMLGRQILVDSNTAGLNGGGIAARQIGLGIDAGTLAFSNNHAANRGGAIYGLDGVAIEGSSGASLILEGNVSGEAGGAVYSGSNISISGSYAQVLIHDNTADTGRGGAVYAGGGFTLAADGPVIFYNNSSGDLGGAVYADSGSSAIIASGGDVTFSGNRDSHGASALHMGNSDNGSVLDLDATAGRVIAFYDPVTSDLSQSAVTVNINRNGEGAVVFSGENYTAGSADVWSAIKADTTVYGGVMILKDNAEYGVNQAATSFALAGTGTLDSVAAKAGVNNIIHAENSGLFGLVRYLNQDANASGYHTLTFDGNVGGGAVISMNTDIAANSSVIYNGASDFLVINGVADGAQVIAINNRGDIPAGTETALHLVQTGSSTGASVFSGSTRISKGMGALEYQVMNGTEADASYQANTSGGDNNWYLVLTDDSSSPGDGGKSVLNIFTAPAAAWFEQDTLVKRMGELRLDETLFGNTEREHDWEAWVRGYGSQYNIGGAAGGSPFRNLIYGTDLGADKRWCPDRRNVFYTGVFGGYGRVEQDYRAYYDGSGASESFYLGTYATWLHETGWYADFVAKGAHYDNSFDTRDQSSTSTNGDYESWAAGVSLELGRQFKFKDGWFAEPQVQASYMHLFSGDYRTSGDNQFAVSQSDGDYLQFRFGSLFGRTIKFANSKQLLQPYVKVFGQQQISSGGYVRASGGEWRPNLDGAAAILGCGLVCRIDEVNQLHLDYEASFGDKYDKPWGLNFGYRHQF
jgi:outer membrane autotransporter protein